MEKNTWMGILGGMLIGAGIVFTTLFLYSRSNPAINTVITPIQTEQTVMQPPIALVINGREEIATSGKNLCEILTVAEVNSLVPGVNARNSQSPIDSHGQCLYFRDRGTEPFIAFNNSLYSFATAKELVAKAGGEIKILNDVGDEAFFSKSTSIINNLDRQALNSIAFRTGSFVYTIAASQLSEAQLKTLANAVIKKLTPQ
jgi:hypothetical protein